MAPKKNSREDFANKRDALFKTGIVNHDAFKFSMEYSLLVEEQIRLLSAGNKYNFAVVSAGSFSRRELSPYSDIDLMILTESVEKDGLEITGLITSLWDNGIEVSHTVRELNDISRFLEDELHTFTQFFETRFIMGNDSIYQKWNKQIFKVLTDEIRIKLILELFRDIEARYAKFGDSPKVLEPNIKQSAGGLRDFHAVEWMFILQNKTLLNKQNEETQTEIFIELLKKFNYTTANECARLVRSYQLILTIRNLLHLISKQKNDRLEFNAQTKLARLLYHKKDSLGIFMRDYFKAANVLNRFCKSMLKKFHEEITTSLPDSLAISLDDHFVLKGKTISIINNNELKLSDILRAFYYRGLYSAHFDENLRSLIIATIEELAENSSHEIESSVFFREILRLPHNVGQTLSVMNELGVLGAYMPEFADLVGYLQHGVYHCYTADEHTLVTISNLEKLEKDVSLLGRIYNSLNDHEVLFLAMLFHDIAKPVNLSGHEIIGAEIAASVMQCMGYGDEEIEKVSLLVRNHLVMEQTAFRRNLNDPETLNNFASRFKTVEELDLLYLVTYADLSAVNPAVWTSWKSDLLSELYRKSKAMLEDQISGEELLISSTYIIPKDISKHSQHINEDNVQEHIDSINDIAYANQFTDEEIAKHVEEIQRGENVSAFFKEINDYTNVTIITKDYPSLLSRLCGAFSINDANIHDAKIFTRKDGIVIDTFNLTDFRTQKKIDPVRYEKIKKDLSAVVSGMLQLNQEFARMKNKWWRIENKFFKRTGKVKVVFENHDKYTILDISSPDRLGFLYQVTRKMNELGLIIYFAKISTKGDDILDSFYVLHRNGKKVSPNDYELIITELTSTINLML
ncbi:MAG: [protein-PII] uridylyltransferase [Ignavibacteria bacterium CG2_30_36_16]|nr:MAG: [protein-PII] uridylyltransferase [Ignavibacteria bacterium CG2_30_36_16]